MSSLYRPIDALEVASEYIKGMPIERMQARILDDASRHLWMSAPWRWTIGNVGSITLVSGSQDYTLAAPNDMLYPLYAYYADGSTTPQYIHIEPKQPTLVIQQGNPQRLSYEGSNTWRFYPKPVVTGTKQVIIQYKKTAPLIDNRTAYVAGTQVFDDEWFWVYQLGVMWKAFLYADDNRAGQATFQDGKVNYSGLRAEFESAIQYMREREKLPIFGYQLAPDPVVGNK